MSLFTATTVEEVKRLIELGHNVNIINESGLTVLHHACSKGNLDIVKVLCEAGANVNKMSRGYYPIDKATEADNLDIIKYFIENPLVKLDNVLSIAAIDGHTDVIDYLLGLNLELDSSGYNPLITACYYGQIDVVDRLLYAGANTNIVNICGHTALIVATNHNRLDIIKRLVMFGADYHTYGGRSLCISCHNSYDEISEFLIDLGCSLDYYFDDMTPLMHACRNNNSKIVKLLLEHGADPNFETDNGKKAIDYCKSDELKALFIKN